MQSLKRILSALFVASLLLGAGGARAERIKDIASVAGVRFNQLIGYGLVVGLDGSGDQTSQAPFTVQSLKNMLAKFGVNVPANVSPQLKNAAAVVINADLPPFAKPGQTIDITVSSIGNAKSLRGGTLLMSPLKGADGQVYAIAQGHLIVGGMGAAGSDGSKITINIPSVGRIPNGATVERAVANPFDSGDYVTLNLNSPDFTTASRLVKAVNRVLGQGTAAAIDGGSIRVRAPLDPSQRVAYVSTLENIAVTPGDAPARVIVNARTGTVVIGDNVRVSPAAVSHGNLTVTITERPKVSQPAPLAGGRTAVVPTSNVQITQENARMFMFNPGASLEDIVRAVNQVGTAPGDLVAILEALKQAGALHAELIVI